MFDDIHSCFKLSPLSIIITSLYM